MSSSESTGVHKAAVLMVLLGEDLASQIYRHLPQEDLEQLTQAVAKLQSIEPETALAVLEEYHIANHAQDGLARGGADYAQRVLVKAFGDDSARHLLKQVSYAAERGSSNLDLLQKSDPQQLAKFLEGEHPQTIALVLAHLNSQHASELLMLLPETHRSEAVKRMAQLRQFSPEIARKVYSTLQKRMEAVGDRERRSYAGFQGVADLLNRVDAMQSRVILETIERDDPEVALGVRDLMFTFQDLLSVPEASIRELLGQLHKKTLAVALRGATEELKNYIFKSMSSRAADMLKEDMEVMGPVRARDVSRAQQEIVAVARQLESDGHLSLGMKSTDEYVV